MSKHLSIVNSHVQLSPSARILEIGPLDSPTFKRPTYNVSYVDYATREELAKKGSVNPRYRYEGLVDVDYVVRGGRYGDFIDDRFDLVVANHVFEHIADPIAWLHDLGTLLRADGYVFLSIPDRRYTFDILRREASIVDLLRAHVTKQIKPDFFNLLDHFWHTRPVKAHDVWGGAHHELLKQRRFTGEQVISTSLRHSKDPYADVHCYAYSELSFRTLLGDLIELGLLGFQKFEVFPVVSGGNEFYCVLSQFESAKAGNIGLSI